ncbi:MAG TPA: hypothetical protein DHV53_10825 [Gammaproteobacteria bacterium]|nr:hypothetical protein [Gammaproteobacteria bacterium]HAO87499.1 hypothetical protein [Gammaproteobacteria bacterium]HAR90882.1 hypothetical protein [Gammaproteobacteria bacterium]HAU25347.1 hypothetical protein [Gammaproteobacteria bacterium]HBJ90339.1 hypothetical protein [Gammaproteobacteria bacterium]
MLWVVAKIVVYIQHNEYVLKIAHKRFLLKMPLIRRLFLRGITARKQRYNGFSIALLNGEHLPIR